MVSAAGSRAAPVYQPAPEQDDPWWKRGWHKFRSWPLWAQIAAWFFLAVVLIGPFAGSDSSSDDDAERAAATETDSGDGPAPSTTAPFPSTTEPSTTEPPATTTAPTTTAPPQLHVLTFEERLEDDLAAGAFDVCKQFVEQRLRSPGSAEYPDFYEDDDEFLVAVTRLGNYRLNSHVDSENGFGALLRSQYECTVHFEGGDQWTLVRLFVI